MICLKFSLPSIGQISKLQMFSGRNSVTIVTLALASQSFLNCSNHSNDNCSEAIAVLHRANNW